MREGWKWCAGDLRLRFPAACEMRYPGVRRSRAFNNCRRYFGAFPDGASSCRTLAHFSLSLRRFCCLIFSDFEILGVQHGPDYKIENVCIGVFVINDDNYLLGLL